MNKTIKTATLISLLFLGSAMCASAEWEETPYGKYWTGDGKPEPISALKGTSVN